MIARKRVWSEAGKIAELHQPAWLCLEDAGNVEVSTALPFSLLDPPEKLRRSGSRARLNVCECLGLGLASGLRSR